MKKLLIVGLSIAFGVTLSLGIAACGGNSEADAETAKEAIKTVTSLHSGVSDETATSYKLGSATRVGTQVITIDWSVSSEFEGYEAYVSVGEPDASKQVTVSITQHESEVIAYTLTASVTVGKATETKDFPHTIPASGKIYTPTEAKELAGTLAADAYYMEDDVVTAINVKGYVVAIEGGWNTQYNELQKVYIGDTAETAKTDALYVYYIDSDPVYMTKEFDVEVGDLITVRGALQNYKGNTPELTYNGTGESRIDPVIVAPIQKAPKTDAQILDDAKNALKINEYYSATGDYELPVPIKGVTAVWELEGGNNEYVKVEGGKLTVLKLPDTETSYKLTATLSYGTATPVEAKFPFKLIKLTLTHAGTQNDPFTPAEALTIAATLEDRQYYSDENGIKAVYVKGKVVDVGTWSGGTYNNYNTVYIIAEDAYTKDANKNTTGAIQVYRIASTAELTEGKLQHGDTLLLLCGIQKWGTTLELGSQKGESANAATLVEYTPAVDERTAQEKVNDALNALAATFTVTKTGATALPASTEKDVTFTWATEDETYTITDNKINVAELPAADVTVTATVTATCGTNALTNNTKQVTITIRAQSTTPVGDTLELTRETVFAGLSGNGYNPYNGAHTVNGTTVTTSNVLGTDNYYDGTSNYPYGFTVMQFKANAGTLTLKGTFTKIVVVIATSHDYDSADKLTITAGTTALTAGDHTEADANFSYNNSAWKFYTIEYDVTTTGEQTITFTGGAHAVYVKSITLTGTASQGGTDEPGPGPEPSDADATLSFADTANRTEASAQVQVWQQNNVTITVSKGGSNQDINERYFNPLRIYQSNTVKIEYTSAMTKLVFHCATTYQDKDYPGALQTSLSSVSGITVTVDGLDVTVTFGTAAASLDFTASAQIRLESIDVYAGGGTTTPKTDAEKLDDAKAALKLSKTSLDAVDDEVALPATQGEASVSYELEEATDLVKIEGGKLIVLKLPETDTEITIIATLTVGQESDTVELKVTIVAAEPEITGDLLYTLTTATERGTSNSYTSNCDIEVGGVTWNLEGNSQINPWRLGGKSGNCVATDRKLTSKTTFGGTVQSLAITFGTAIITVNSVTFNVFTSDPTADDATPSFTKTVKFTASGTVNVAAPAGGWKDCYYQLVFNLTSNSSTNQYVQISTIAFYGELPAHVHQYVYTHNEGAWTHTGTCSVPGCDKPEITEKCTPELNHCEDCNHTYSALEIVTQLYTLTSGQTMPGTYSLQGEVTKIDTAYDSTYQNVTFTITVEEKTVQCFHEKSSYSSTVKVGDVVTVEGVLTCYGNSATKEFNANCKIVALEPAAAAASVAPVAMLPGKQF